MSLEGFADAGNAGFGALATGRGVGRSRVTGGGATTGAGLGADTNASKARRADRLGSMRRTMAPGAASGATMDAAANGAVT